MDKEYESLGVTELALNMTPWQLLPCIARGSALQTRREGTVSLPT